MITEVRNGVLYFDGCSTAELAEKYGTPLYVMSQTEIERRIHELKRCFEEPYENTRIAYASKAFCSLAMYRICQREGLCIDIVSGGELYAAMKVGFPAERIEFNGNNKLPQEIEAAVDYGVGRFIIDGLQELSLLESICREKQKKVNVLYRITPGIAASSHDYMVTGKKDSKFGIPLDEDVFYPQIERAIGSEYVNCLGLHFHIGSQLFDPQVYLKSLDVLLEKVRGIKKYFDFEVKELNLGGGFGVTYTDEKREPFETFLHPMMEKIQKAYQDMGMAMPAVVIEPGRSVVAEAGMTLYTIGSIKDIKGVRKYVSVDGGMTDNIRPALYQAEYAGMVVNKGDCTDTEEVTICGRCCESGDILIKDLQIAKGTEAGDIFGIFSTGAYGFSMASNYNSHPIPAVVMVKEGAAELVVKRQTYDDMFCNHLVPKSLEKKEV